MIVKKGLFNVISIVCKEKQMVHAGHAMNWISRILELDLFSPIIIRKTNPSIFDALFFIKITQILNVLVKGVL